MSFGRALQIVAEALLDIRGYWATVDELRGEWAYEPQAKDSTDRMYRCMLRGCRVSRHGWGLLGQTAADPSRAKILCNSREGDDVPGQGLVHWNREG